MILFLICLSVSLILGWAEDGVFADDVKILGAKLRAKALKDGKNFSRKGWKVTGRVTWKAANTKHSSGYALLQMEPKSRLSRSIEIKELTPVYAKHPIKIEHWRAFVSLSLRNAAAKPLALRPGLAIRFLGDEQVTLAPKLLFCGVGPERRAVAVLPAAALTPGNWTLEISVTGNRAVLIEDLRLTRIPVHRSQMRFAKPNGKNGPDRLEAGALGLVAYTAHNHGPLPIVKVRDSSPAAAAKIQVGDVILGIDGVPFAKSSCKPGYAWFDEGHESRFGHAVEAALTRKDRRVKLTFWRQGKIRKVALNLAARRPLPQDFPFDDKVSPKLYEDLLAFIRRTRKPKGHWANGGSDWIQTSFAGLALLGRRDPQDTMAVREIANWFLNKFPDPERFGNLGFWAASYSGIFMTEYLLATGDESVRPWIERTLAWIEDGFHTSKWGTPALGHGPSGLPYGQKALMAPASHVVVFEALAQKAGIKSKIWETLLPYMEHSWSNPEQGGHGSMGYNGSYRDKGEFWSRSGLFALAANMRGEKKGMRKAITSFMRKSHAWMRNSHAYGNPGDTWGLIGLAACDRKAFREVMTAWRWAFGGAWQPGYGLRHTMAHMGSPYMGGEGLVNPAFAALLSVRNRGLFITGAPDSDRGWLRARFAKIKGAGDPVHDRVDLSWDPKGRVVLASAASGMRLRFTMDGREPSSKSEVYKSPISLPAGGVVQVRVESKKGALGRVFRREFSLPKSDWKIVSCQGAADDKDAMARASRWIDGDRQRPWQPQRGQDSQGLPLTVTIDLGRSFVFDGFVFRGKNRPQQLRAAWADAVGDLDAGLHDIKVGASNDYSCGALVSARFLKIVISELPKGHKMRFFELDLTWPEIPMRIESQDGSSYRDVQIASAPKGLIIRYERGKKHPTAKSKVFSGDLRVRKDGVLRLRLFDRSGRAVGPERCFTP